MRHKTRKNRKLIKNPVLRNIVLKWLRKKWSPEQVSKTLRRLYPHDDSMNISHESIYSYIYILPRGTLKKRLTNYLRQHHRSRKLKAKNNSNLGAIQNFFSITERPIEVADRIIPGHWEGDLIIGKDNQSAIGTLVERTTRMTFLVKLKNQDAITIRKAYAKQFKSLPNGLRKTLTYDRGSEMAQHKLFTKETDMNVYFCHPKSPWERGTNENTNGLLRQYFPRGTDLNKYSAHQIKLIQDEFNDRPRKALDWYSPHECFSKLLQ